MIRFSEVKLCRVILQVNFSTNHISNRGAMWITGVLPAMTDKNKHVMFSV